MSGCRDARCKDYGENPLRKWGSLGALDQRAGPRRQGEAHVAAIGFARVEVGNAPDVEGVNEMVFMRARGLWRVSKFGSTRPMFRQRQHHGTRFDSNRPAWSVRRRRYLEVSLQSQGQIRLAQYLQILSGHAMIAVQVMALLNTLNFGCLNSLSLNSDTQAVCLSVENLVPGNG
jgi:hypothetical protein